MFSQKLILPAFALLSVAAAQTSICSQATATINSQADATAFAGCPTIQGSVVIGSSAGGVLSLDGPQQITGDLTVSDAVNLTSLSSSTLGSIGGAFSLSGLTQLSTLQFNDLTSVKTIDFVALPALSEFTFPSTISKATSVTVSNTFLNTLDGINLNTVATLQIDNNNQLKTFSTQIANVTSSVNIVSNGGSLDVQFPNLIWAANMTLRNVSSVTIPSLSVVNGSLGFYGNNLQTIFAPNLTTVGNTGSGVGSLAVDANGGLTNLTMSSLKNVGGAAQIANNTGLNTISFPALSFVGGAIDFSGNFSTPSLPALTEVKGGFNMQSQSNIDCTTFQGEKGKVIQGSFVCKTTADVTSLGGTTTTGSGSSASSTSSKSAATSYGLSEAAAGLSVVGGLLQMLL